MYNFLKKKFEIFELVIGLAIVIFSGKIIFLGVLSFFQRDVSKKQLDDEGYLFFGLILIPLFLSSIFAIYKRLRSK